MFKPFYFNLIRKYIICFGTLFNNIYITRTDKNGTVTNLMRVPITYGPKEKALSRVVEDPNIDRPTAVFPLPMMSFEITGFDYDSSRKLQSVNRVSVTDTDTNKRKSQYAPVPYNITFQLSILCKNAEDGTKIVEQILPFFTPDWTVTANIIPEMNIKHDIPIILNRVNIEDVYDGDFDKRRSMVWALDFTLKGYLYGPVKTAKVIKYANTQIFIPPDTADSISDVDDPIVTIHIQPGLTSNGQPTSNSSISIPVNDIVASDDFGFVTVITETL